jgi:hypothetical protein
MDRGVIMGDDEIGIFLEVPLFPGITGEMSPMTSMW